MIGDCREKKTVSETFQLNFCNLTTEKLSNLFPSPITPITIINLITLLIMLSITLVVWFFLMLTQDRDKIHKDGGLVLDGATNTDNISEN
jgi:hypothetical protein